MLDCSGACGGPANVYVFKFGMDCRPPSYESHVTIIHSFGHLVIHN